MIEGAQAVVFDMDGVLWSSSRAHAAAYAAAFAEAGVVAPPYEALAGRRTPEAVEAVLRENGRPSTAHDVDVVVRRKRALVREVLRREPPIAPDAASTVRTIASTGTNVGLASSASRGSVEIFTAASGLSDVLQVILCGDDVERAKPAPDIYLAACASLGVTTAETIVVEDSLSGIQAARSAGARVVGIVGTHSHEELAATGVAAVIRTLSELVDR